MRVLVAGCGWLGCAVGRALASRGDRVIGVRRAPSAARELTELGIEPLLLDLNEPAALERLPRELDAIVACQSAGGPGVEAYERAYLDATRVLLELAREQPAACLVYTGSTGVFGHDDGRTVDEETPPAPRRPTAAILARAERLLLEAGRTGTAVRLLRLSGLYGPGRYGIVERVRSGRLYLGPGDDGWMNFCHRDDAAATVLALLDAGRPAAVYHASDAEPARRRDVVRWIARRLGIEPPRAAGGAPARARANRRISAERTRAELGLELRFPSFRDGLAPVLG